MDFTLSDRETCFRDRVRDLIGLNIPPRQDDWKADCVSSGDVGASR